MTPASGDGIDRRWPRRAASLLTQDGKVEPRIRPRIAAVVTEYRKMDHGQGIVDRFLDGYGWESRHYRPRVDIVSLYVDQKPSGRPERGTRQQRHPELKVYPTIAEALTCGGDRLAVDGVLIDRRARPISRATPRARGSIPRYEFFQQIVDVFRRSGRSVPVFNDKHLSWSWDWAKEMVETARAMGFPLMAGSSLPVTWRFPRSMSRMGPESRKWSCVGYGGIDSYDFHGLETLQCMVERRKGGETGVSAVAGPAR